MGWVFLFNLMLIAIPVLTGKIVRHNDEPAISDRRAVWLYVRGLTILAFLWVVPVIRPARDYGGVVYAWYAGYVMVYLRAYYLNKHAGDPRKRKRKPKRKNEWPAEDHEWLYPEQRQRRWFQ